MRIPYKEMISEFTRVLVKYGFSCESAKSAAKIFADNSLCGVYSHGLNRFPIFIEALKKGKIDPDKEKDVTGILTNITNGKGKIIKFSKKFLTKPD